jgi:hypothetical protein
MKGKMWTSLVAAALLLGLISGPALAATCTPTGFFRDGHNMTAAMINPGDVSGATVDATGCNIGIFFGPGSSGSVDSSRVMNANYFGIVVAGDIVDASGNETSVGATSVDVTNNAVSNIGESPLNGDQHGVAIYYRACAPNSSATGTVAGNTLIDYQKGGIVVSCSGAATSISGNTVTGQGPVNYIAQNGIQVGYGATGQVMRNAVTGNAYSGTNDASSAGILIVGGPCFGEPLTTGIQNVKNTVDGNDVGIWLANLNTDCVSPPTTSTNNKVINNEISDLAVTNVSGNGYPYGYQAGISDTGVNDKLINNSISGTGYTPSNCGQSGVTAICAIDTSTAANAKVHANAIPQ